ncbi:hypothetical protein LX99_00505 [Mucilaginibacter oryzae]|uniref:Uncharacterized protein n=1 Tax=Mucilaginibacter oryzae TaxID=468058 RepID=A0A316HJ37_9SPHI|nr:hypothetical protein LX99_00505 [Mucilaginibacter oryzae]
MPYIYISQTQFMSPTKKSDKATNANNPIVKMIEDKKRIVKAIKNGESLSTLKDIKIVSPL